MSQVKIYFASLNFDQCKFTVFPLPSDQSIKVGNNGGYEVIINLESAGAIESMPLREVVERCKSHLIKECGLEEEKLAF